MASRSLSPKRVLERLRQHRACVLTLANQAAKKEIKRQLKALGLHPREMSYRDLCLEAERWFEAHRAELIAEAEHVIATSPYFVQWRIPVFEKVAITEHSPNANTTISGQSAND
jgi:hypothetical protein